MTLRQNLQYYTIMIMNVERVQQNVPKSMVCHSPLYLLDLNKDKLELSLMLVVLAVKQLYPELWKMTLWTLLCF